MINSRDLAALKPPVAAKAAAFITACRAAGIDVLITSTYRDAEAQTALYARGRTTPGENPRPGKPLGDIVTNAKAGQSFHNYACAFDFVPLVLGKCAWNDDRLFIQCGEIAESVGLEWAGRWTGKMHEMAHCQYTGSLSLADLAAGKEVK
jgi:peptidoglycan L-alanyl-D-glutamate endopeptidase CwlK